MSSMKCLSLYWLICVLCCAQTIDNFPIKLDANINGAGLRGKITFTQARLDGSVSITVELSQTANSLDKKLINSDYKWRIKQHPMLYDQLDQCQDSELGTTLYDLAQKHGLLQLNRETNQSIVYTDNELTLSGLKTIWGRTLLIERVNAKAAKNLKQITCANILNTDNLAKNAEAVFSYPMAGHVIFRENIFGETLIYAHFHGTDDNKRLTYAHSWKILVTDIFDNKRNRKCDYLSIVLDVNTDLDESRCSMTDHKNCKIGDLSKKLDNLKVPGYYRANKQTYLDTNLPLTYFDSTREVYLVVYERNNPNKIMTCSQIATVSPRTARADIDMKSVKGTFKFTQNSRMDPTIVSIDLKNLQGNARYFHVHELPVPVKRMKDDSLCSDKSVGGHFNPYNIDQDNSPAAGVGTVDEYELGDLSGKYGLLKNENNDPVFNVHFDLNLPLFGENSIIGRSIVIHKPNKDRWVCATIESLSTIVYTTAVATFYYPIVGQVIFRQEKDKPWSETMILVELSYSDGSLNDTMDHTWYIHNKAPSNDFLGWKDRCLSVDDRYNPYGKIYPKNGKGAMTSFGFYIGDLTLKSKTTLKITASKGSAKNRYFYTDINLPLSGPNSVIGRSVVIEDKLAPKQRGKRLACSVIKQVHPIMATVRNWKKEKNNEAGLAGSIVFYQTLESDPTLTKVDLYGLDKQVSVYDIHEVWTTNDKEFPCSADALNELYNPFLVDPNIGPSPTIGSFDQYAVGDLAGKYGLLNDIQHHKKDFRDNNLPLFGPLSIVGRSVVVHKKERNQPWSCGTIKIEARKDEAREIVAIATFDDPRTLVAGYIRLRQLEYKDGSYSDTYIEVDLKHEGSNNKNITNNHNWKVFVNQVGEDAYVKAEKVRCLAAGYEWNPYLVDTKSELYKTDCGRNNLLRCAMGDLRGKFGPLRIGDKKAVYTDPNLPLFGNYSILRRSIVIYDKEGSDIKLACANIKQDIHIVGNVAIKKYPSFTLDRFMDQMRSVLGTRPWLVSADTQTMRDMSESGCIHLTINFYGPEAYRLQIEFGNLINFGSVIKNDRSGVTTLYTHYRPCHSIDVNRSSKLYSLWSLAEK